MANLTAHVRLRPIRFGFLVQPDDNHRLLEVFRVNTCLWGGRFNPVIPHLTTVPPWWDRHGLLFETAAQIVNGYLDFFEPDFLVECTPGLAADVHFDKTRVLSLADMLQREGDDHKQGHGQNVMALYGDLYRKVFQFARRHDHDIVNVTAEDTSCAGVAACIAGGFPTDGDLAYFARAFLDAFEPKAVALNGATLTQLFESGFTSALRIGHRGIDADQYGWHDPALFVFDAFKGIDLIDFWNLRAVRRNVLPVPMQWLPDLSPFCRKAIAANHRPLPGNPHGVMIRETVMFGRAIAGELIETLYNEHLRVDINGANVRQDWYPKLWRRPSTRGAQERRATLTAARKSFHTSSAEGKMELQFDSLHPEWSDDYGSDLRWANVVKIDDWTFRDLAATAFPNDRKRAFVPRLGIGGEHRLSTTEGIIVFPKFKNIPINWELPTGGDAIAEWLKSNGVASVSSDAGRVTDQVVQSLGGFNRVGDIANQDVLRTLDDMSRRPITHSAHHLKFRNQIERAVKGNIWRERTFETLVERGAVRLGLEVRCENCSSWSWFALNQLNYELQCSLCLRTTRFPVVDPGQPEKARWAYRVVGPFALPDYAKGGYAAALTLRCFADVIGGHRHAHTTWSAGRELTLGAHQKVETDFVLWYQRRSVVDDGQDAPTDLVFGEAKSFGRDTFKAEDVGNLRALAERFPGAVLAFATLRLPNELTSTELESIRTLALWGREYVDGDFRTRAPVVVLTGIELFAGFSLDDAWKKAGGEHAQFGEARGLETANLRILADVTQQLYLGLPSYSAWHQAKWERIHADRKARADAEGTASEVAANESDSN